MSLLLKNNLIYIHLPKTGGTALRHFFKEQDLVIRKFKAGPVANSIQANRRSEYLRNNPNYYRTSETKTQHRIPTLSQLTANGTGYEIDNSSIFTFVRNPYEWYKSFFYFKMSERKWSRKFDYPDHLFEIEGGIPKIFFHHQIEYDPSKPPKLIHTASPFGIEHWEQLFDVFVDELWVKSTTMAEGRGPISFYCQRIASIVEAERISPDLQIGKYEEMVWFLNSVLIKAGYTPQEAQRLSKEFEDFRHINKTSKKSEKDISLESMQKIYELEKDIFNLYNYNKRF